ncbi:MAG: phospholipid carrier-dependent glycosyltransferase [Candidatus Pacebacteria bacterium]|nr:phospholipid carrier-dependent glycosyltransferase [Candidatus Paceibacterota bacterium]
MKIKKLLQKLPYWLLLLLIIIIAFSLRIYLIDQAPKGALVDEAHFGFLAKSLLKTGKDEHGVSYPIIFKGFGDDKLPAMAYAMMPFVKIFGLSTFTIRLPSVLAGTFLVAVIYLLLKELNFKPTLALWGSLLTAISPWPFLLSRIGFESNLALLFFTIGLVFLVKLLKKPHQLWALLAALFFAFTWYSYIAYRPVTLALSLMILGWQAWHKKLSLKTLVVFITTLLVAVSPLFFGKAAQSNTTRLQQIGIFYDPGIKLKVDEQRAFCQMRFPKEYCHLVFNKVYLISYMLTDRALHTFSPQYLATEGEVDQPALNSANFGQFYPVFYLAFLLGLVALLFNKNHQLDLTLKLLIGLGLVIAPIPALLAGWPQKVRLSPLYPFMTITIVLGLAYAFKLAKQKATWLATLLSITVLVLATGYTTVYITDFWAVHAYKKETAYQGYLPELFGYLQLYKFNDPQVEIVIKSFFSDPLMFYAFYNDMNPALYQKLAVLGELEASGFQHTVGLGNLRVEGSPNAQKLGCEAKQQNKTIILVTDEQQDMPALHIVKSSNRVHDYVYVYETNKAVNDSACF